MPPILQRVFTDHPASVNENYLEHSGFALRFAGLLLAAAGAALVHALVPCLFERTASNIVKRLHARIADRSSH
ncbi:MAG: hypothetical protein KDJ48_00320 [Nitratireductor sp.]|nr:hypothetical protein [Nitratireductor sp.]MCB1457549.1 hypothetical protein [Nitratireductor sp.]MCB1457715.1 hypothetical protein [Nitratireductor sp.]